MREINKIAESLFEKIRDRFEDVSLGDDKAKATQDPEKARFFNFDYVVDDKNYGNITISIIDETSLKVYFSKNISHNLTDEQQQQWYGFLRELREFAKRNLLSFEPRDITRSTLKHRDIQQVSKSDDTYSKNDVVSEGRMYGTLNRSYEDFGPVRIKVAHAKPIMDETHGARSRNIQAVFVENELGERFRMPFNGLIGTRAMARHISAGGAPHDEFGQHICKMVEELNKLRPFIRSMSHRQFEDVITNEMLESAFEYHSLLKNTLKKIKGKKGYNEYKESYTPTLNETGVDVDSIREKFVKKVFPDRLTDALPIVHKAYKMKKENNNPYAHQFEAWANTVAEDWDDSDDAQQWGAEPINVDDLADVMSDPLPFGVDAINATAAIEGVINNDELVSEMELAAKEDPEADARDFIMFWLENNEPNVYQELMNEIGDADTADQYGSADGGMDGSVNESHDSYDEDNVEAIQTAILRRILGNIGQHSELLKAVGPEGVMNAAGDVASFHAPVEELGSSDISIMVREVYQEAGVEYPEMNEADNAPLRKTASPKKKARDTKYYDYLARTLGEALNEKYCDACDSTDCHCEELDEGRVKELEMDLKDLTDAEFVAKYNKTKEEMKAGLSEEVNVDYVNKKEKLAKAMAHRAPKKPEQSFLDKVKDIGKGAKAWVKGEDDSMYESEENLAEMRRLAGLK